MADNRELLLIEIREDGARVVRRRIDDIGKSGGQVTDQMSKLKSVLGGLISAKLLKDTVLLADTYANMLNRLRVVTDGNYELYAAMDAVYQMSRDTRSALESNIDMYARVAINTRQMGMEMEDVIEFSTQLNHAIILSGVTAREAQWGMVQFSQALASNALRGDELRAVLEQLPVVTDVIADHFGVTRGELRELGFQGRITAKEIIKAFKEAEQSLADRFAKRIPTIDQSVTVLRASITQFIGKLDQTYQLTAKLARGFLFVADHMDMFGRIALTAGTVLGAVYLKNLIQIIAQMKLFSTTLLRAHPLAAIMLTGAAAMAIYSDKIKIANDSSATLADLMSALGDNAKTTYAALRDSVSSLLDTDKINTEYEVTFSLILRDAAAFIDKFLGFFVGAGQVIVKVFSDIPTGLKMVWNAIITGIEYVTDVINAALETVAQGVVGLGRGVYAGMVEMANAFDYLVARKGAAAKTSAKQAMMAFENSLTGLTASGFGSALQANIKDNFSEEGLSGLKFNVEQGGETLGEAFMRGFNMSTLVSSGVEDLLAKADQKANAGTGAPSAGGGAKWSPTPVQSQLIKEMTGDAGRLVGEMQALEDLWNEMSQRPESERLIDFEQYTLKMRELKYEMLETSTAAADGFSRGFLKVGMEVSDFASTAENVVTSAFDSMGDALADFISTGKADWTGLVQSMIGEISKLITKWLMFQAIKTVGNAISPGLGSSLTGAMATGGSASPGGSYLVGERGPEIFTPAQPGTVTPNSGMMSGANTGNGEATPANVTVIVVDSMEKALAAMKSSEGQRIIVETADARNASR